MYLRGGSRRGDDIERLRESGHGLPAMVEKSKSFPFIVLSPQCPDGEYWTDSETLVALLDEVMKMYSVDPERVYLTGHSIADTTFSMSTKTRSFVRGFCNTG
jgi:predicted peptidase